MIMPTELMRLAFKSGLWEAFRALNVVLKEIAREQKSSVVRELADEIQQVFLKHFSRL